MRRLRVRDALCTLSALLAATAPGAWAQDAALPVEAAIERAITHSRSLQAARYEFALAVERHRIGLRLLFPTLSAGYADSNTVSYGGPDNRFRSLTVGVSQRVYDRGATIHRRRSEARALEIQRDQLSVREENLARRVVQLYTEILRFQSRAETLERTKSIAERQVKIVNEELAVGRSTRLELIELELGVADIEIEVQEADMEARRLTYQLAQLLELSIPELPDVAGSIRRDYGTILHADFPEYYLELAERHQTTKREAELALDVARENLRRARLHWVPSVSTDLEFSATGTSFPLTEPSFSVSVSLAWDLPGMPATLDLSAQRTPPDDRTRSAGADTAPLDNIEGFQSRRRAELGLLQQAIAVEEQDEELAFYVQSQLDLIDQQRNRRTLLDRQRELENEKRSVEVVLLEQGDLRRIDFLQSEIERARQEIALVDAVVDLFNAEIELLARSGAPDLARFHGALIGPER